MKIVPEMWCGNTACTGAFGRDTWQYQGNHENNVDIIDLKEEF